ncbi:MAG: hypothetical protein M1821_001768 [Bathelium mastoideum]|nr:MAG: hypothetical protein M1821_001768 [Bathelium mastoideum]
MALLNNMGKRVEEHKIRLWDKEGKDTTTTAVEEHHPCNRVPEGFAPAYALKSPYGVEKVVCYQSETCKGEPSGEYQEPQAGVRAKPFTGYQVFLSNQLEEGKGKPEAESKP